MSVTQSEKQQIIADYARSEGDTGSVEVQVAVLTRRIENLTAHLKTHKKDVSTTRGLLGLVARRRRLLRYLLGRDSARHHALVERLGLRH